MSDFDALPLWAVHISDGVLTGPWLGSGFALKFVILAALSDPTGGRLKRLLLLAVEGATLGTLTQDPLPTAAGYIAFFTLLLFLIAVWALAPPQRHTANWRLKIED